MSNEKIITLSEVKQHNSSNDLWVVIENKVYDLTKFRNEHPGGEEPLDESAGKDATKDFIDVGHSNEAREMMIKYQIGVLPENERNDLKPSPKRIPYGAIISFGAVILSVGVVFLIRKFVNRN